MNHMLSVGLLGLAAVALCWSLAVVLFRVGPTGGVARRLSGLLVVEGVTLITAGFPEFVLGLSEDFWLEHMTYTILSGLVHFLGDAFKQDPEWRWVSVALPIGMALGGVTNGWLSDAVFGSRRGGVISAGDADQASD